VYPYFAVWPFVPLAALGHGLASAVFISIVVVAVVAACFAASDRDPWRAALVLASAYTITGLQLGALSPLLFAGAVFLWVLRDRPVAFALLAAPVIGSKLFLAPLLLWPLLSGRYRAFLYACGSSFVLLALSFALGPVSSGTYFDMLSQLSSHEARSGFSLIGGLMNAGLSSGAARAVAVGVAVAVIAGAWVGWRRTGREAALFCGALAASLLLTPVMWSHYLVLTMAGALALGLRRRWIAVLALASWAIAPPHNVHPDMDMINGVTSSTTWMLVLLAAAAAYRPPSIAFRRNGRARASAATDHRDRTVGA
jgi:hypothetical protein